MATSLGVKPFKTLLLTATLSSLFVLGAWAQDQDQDPPTRVADLNYLSGNVSMQPAGADDWSPAVMNRPFTTGDYLWADADSAAELHLNNAAIRIGSQSSIGFLNLDDRLAQIRFAQGELVVRVQHLGEDESIEVDTPNAAITILREGEYRFNADPDSATTWVVVRHGSAEVTGGGQAFTVRAGNSAQLSGTDQLNFDVQYAPDLDGFEAWCEDRDAHEAQSESARYLPPDVIGGEELDNHGTWRETAGYGPVWYPSVDASWAPYRDGHWAWIEPWGWTWVDNAPWGFAPCHYGRWAFVSGAWGWVPGPLVVAGGARRGVVAAVYAPALVAFVGGGNWGVSLSIGGPAVGWVPLGPGEVYAPAYQMSRNYFQRVNVSNTTVVNNVNITNVYNNVYVNKNVTNVTVNRTYVNASAPNAVTAMPQGAFASGRPVRQAGIVVPRNQAVQIQSAPTAVAPPVAPVRQALAPVAGTRPATRPPMRAISAPVVAKVAPPPPPVPFAAKQASLQQNLGRPVNIPAIRQTVPARPVATAPVVRVAPPARQVTPQVQPTRPPSAPVAPNRPMTPGQPQQQNFPPRTPQPQQQPVTPRPPQQPPVVPRPPQQPTVTPRVEQNTPQQPVTPRPPQQPPVTPRVEQQREQQPVTPRPQQQPPRETRPTQPPPKPKKETKKDKDK